jgi:hypothetical protein
MKKETGNEGMEKEYGSSRFLRKLGFSLRNYMASYPRRPCLQGKKEAR